METTVPAPRCLQSSRTCAKTTRERKNGAGTGELIGKAWKDTWKDTELPELIEKVRDNSLSGAPLSQRVPEEGDAEGGRRRRLEGTRFPFRFIGLCCLVI